MYLPSSRLPLRDPFSRDVSTYLSWTSVEFSVSGRELEGACNVKENTKPPVYDYSTSLF